MKRQSIVRGRCSKSITSSSLSLKDTHAAFCLVVERWKVPPILRMLNKDRARVGVGTNLNCLAIYAGAGSTATFGSDDELLMLILNYRLKCDRAQPCQNCSRQAFHSLAVMFQEAVLHLNPRSNNLCGHWQLKTCKAELAILSVWSYLLCRTEDQVCHVMGNAPLRMLIARRRATAHPRKTQKL